MTCVKRLTGVATLGVAVLIGCGLSVPPAQTAYIVTLMQEGSNVVASGSGAIDLAGLIINGSGVGSGAIAPGFGLITTGPENALVDMYIGPIVGPLSFGSGLIRTDADSGNGDLEASAAWPRSLAYRWVTSPAVLCWTAQPITIRPL